MLCGVFMNIYTTTMQINLLDLFSGIGGFHLGLERAGFKINAYNSEIDEYAKKVYAHNFKYSTYVGSVTDVRGGELPRIDAITFGSPCQDFSLAGNRSGLGGERSGLIREAIRLIEECKPRFFIWENVKGTFSSNNRQDFAAILQAFANIGNYTIEWQLLNTKWFLPQNRERIYLVGYLGGRSGRQVFPIGESNTKVDELQRQQANTCTLTARYEAGGNGSYVVERKLNAQETIRVHTNNSKGYEEAVEGDSINYQNINSKTRRGRVDKQIAQTLDSGGEQAVLTDKIRRLTPMECERLQGFPDNWTLADGISDTQRYKMCGNAVTVDVVEAVGKSLLNTL